MYTAKQILNRLEQAKDNTKGEYKNNPTTCFYIIFCYISLFVKQDDIYLLYKAAINTLQHNRAHGARPAHGIFLFFLWLPEVSCLLVCI